jgi:hypothetical protein
MEQAFDESVMTKSGRQAPGMGHQRALGADPSTLILKSDCAPALDEISSHSRLPLFAVAPGGASDWWGQQLGKSFPIRPSAQSRSTSLSHLHLHIFEAPAPYLDPSCVAGDG